MAHQYVDYHMKKFDINKSNIKFIEGEIEDLENTGLQKDSFDLVLSNSVINYKRDKKTIIKDVCTVLKPGGEFYFSDVYANQPIPKEYQELLDDEYIGEALRWEDLILYATDAGFTEPRLVTAKKLAIENEDIRKAIGNTKFVSAIFRCFKLPSKEDESTPFTKSYQLTYETPCLHHEEEFYFDISFQFKRGELLVVDDPSIAYMLHLSRYKDHFLFDPVELASSLANVVETIECEQSDASASGGYEEQDNDNKNRTTNEVNRKTKTDA